MHFAEGGARRAGRSLVPDRSAAVQGGSRSPDGRASARAAQLELAQSYRERAERLLARNATSKEEFEQLAADATVAAAQLASISAALERRELDLSFTRVTAPIAGRVSRAIVTAGNSGRRLDRC